MGYRYFSPAKTVITCHLCRHNCVRTQQYNFMCFYRSIDNWCNLFNKCLESAGNEADMGNVETCFVSACNIDLKTRSPQSQLILLKQTSGATRNYNNFVTSSQRHFYLSKYFYFKSYASFLPVISSVRESVSQLFNQFVSQSASH